MGVSYFVTGFPGFIATRIVRKLASTHPEAVITLLVHPSQRLRAEKVREELARETDSSSDRYLFVEGDITKAGLGMQPQLSSTDLADITHVFHLAAVYDLAVDESVAEEINVTGTQNVTNWVAQLKNLERYIYFSTAYVSGKRKGTILENELIDINGFKNHYESTKFKAEVIVQSRMEEIPTTIIRPGVVIGDSRTGTTDKFDGPYFIMRFLDKFSRLPIPYLGRGDALFNVVPVNFVVEATTHLAHFKQAEKKVYHLVDPSPGSAREAYALICEAQLGTRPKYTIPLGLVTVILSVGAIRRWIGVEKETLAYFKIGPIYDSSNCRRDLSALSVTCPDFATYINTAVKYFGEHKSDPAKMIKVT